MNKLIILGLFAVISVCVAQLDVTQSDLEPTTPDPYEDLVSEAEVMRLVLDLTLLKAKLPAGFQERGKQVVESADAQLDTCEQQLRAGGLAKVYKLCTKTVFKVSKLQLKELQKEAAAAATSTVAPEVVA